MKEIVKWLYRIEQLAFDLYKDAAVIFRGDKALAYFLKSLAEDEDVHVRIMKRASESLEEGSNKIPVLISLDNHRRERIEHSLKVSREKLLAGDLSKEAMIGCIVETEFSELNDIFSYVINTLKENNGEFISLASNIVRHRKTIERFVESLPYGHEYLHRIRELQKAGMERILIVDDYAPVVEILMAILAGEGIVESAENAEEGLKKMREHYYDIIISDVNIPVMSGIELFKQAARQDPDIGRRYLFLTGESSPETISFFDKNHLRYLIKPAHLDEIEQSVSDILHGSSLNDHSENLRASV
jgi:CheY-like chemotaxis protein